MPPLVALAAARTRTKGPVRAPDRTITYGVHPLQQLDFHSCGAGQRPLLVFIHGGAWQFGDKARRLADRKIPFAHGEGWHFAALNFRMVPEVGVGDMARDIAEALRLLRDSAGELGIDPGCIVLMGHSSGAHLAALLGTDAQYLREVGLGPEMLAGIIANEGTAYDPKLPAVGWPWLERALIAPALPDARSRGAFAPVLHAACGTNARRFLILSTAHAHGRKHAELLQNTLLEAGNHAELHGFPGRGIAAHVAMSRRFGEAGFAPTEIVRVWLRRL